jgi:hypothetical protein
MKVEEKDEVIINTVLLPINLCTLLRVEQSASVPRSFLRQIWSTSFHNVLGCRSICRTRINTSGFNLVNVKLVLPQRIPKPPASARQHNKPNTAAAGVLAHKLTRDPSWARPLPYSLSLL